MLPAAWFARGAGDVMDEDGGAKKEGKKNAKDWDWKDFKWEYEDYYY